MSRVRPDWIVLKATDEQVCDDLNKSGRGRNTEPPRDRIGFHLTPKTCSSGYLTPRNLIGNFIYFGRDWNTCLAGPRGGFERMRRRETAVRCLHRSSVRSVCLVLLVGVALLAWLPAPGVAQILPSLPRVFLDTTYARPAGHTLTVNAGGDFQAALNSATCGDTIVLQAGASFPGPFYLPNKACPPASGQAGTGWVYIQSSAYTSLPPPGTRVSPSDAVNMPKLVAPNNQSAALITWHGNTGEAPNPAHHYRFVGIEMRPAPGVNPWAIVYLHANNTTAVSQLPHDITFDRVYIHGDPTVGAAKGIVGNAAAIAVVDSWISDIKELKTANTDTQAFNSWNTPGPIKLVNNHLEAAGENVLFGGAAPMIPNVLESDIEIRRNHFYKPVTWNPNGPNYGNVHWGVKNSLEFKHGIRVLVEGNVFENCWADAQGGQMVLLHPTAEVSTQTWIQVSDVTVRYNLLKNAGAAFVLFGNVNNPPYPAPGDAQPSQRILIQNNLAYHMGWQYSVGGVTKLFDMDPDGGANFTIDHNTMLFDGSGQAGLYFNTDGLTTQWANLIVTNNILSAGRYPVGAPASGGFGSTALAYATTRHTFAKNAQIGPWPTAGGVQPSMFTGADHWSLGFPANVAAVQFTNVAAGDYSLAPGSPYNNAGTDGKDIGVDMDALTAATSGVSQGTPDDPPDSASATSASAASAPALSSSSAASGSTPSSSAGSNTGGGGGGCFIATAAYGSALEPRVALLKAFRDQYLMTTRPGRVFVAWYYHTSPPLADRIRQAPVWRGLVRGILWPLVGVVWLILHPGIGVGLLMGGCGALGWLRSRRRRTQ